MKRRRSIWRLLFGILSFQTGSIFGQTILDSATEQAVLNSLRKDDYQNTFVILNELKETYETRKPDKGYPELLIKVSSMLNERGNYELGLQYSFEALNLASSNAELQDQQIEALLEIGYVYYFLDQPDLASDYTNRGLTLARHRGNQAQIASAINLLGSLLLKKGKYGLALQKFDTALQIRTALNDFHGQSATLGNIGLLMEKIEDYPKAMEYQLRSLAIDDSINEELGVAWSNQMLGSLSVKMKNFALAKKYLDSAENKSKELRSNELLLQVLKNKKELLALEGNSREALIYADRYERLRDSLYNRALLGRVSVLQSAYELDRKTKEIASQKLALTRQRNYILVAIIVTLLIGVLAYFYYRSFIQVKKLHRDVSEQHEEIQMQAEELTEANSILVRLNQEIATQKEEIQVQAGELELSNRTISEINQNLELTVKSRTTELVQAYKELDTFFYRASHDFRRPLTTFMGLAEVAKITVKDPNVLELFDKVRQTAVNLDKMLLKLQSISDVGLQQLSFKEVFVSDLFNAIFTTYQDELHEFNVNFKTETSTGSFNSYPALLKVILENLVENAIYFRKSKDAFVKLKVYKRGEEVIFEVSDNGQGIKDELKDSIFEMYFRGNENSKGNGLGLYIVKKAIEKLKGQISFASTYKEGTVFTVSLPVS